MLILFDVINRVMQCTKEQTSVPNLYFGVPCIYELIDHRKPMSIKDIFTF
jgi:hypothetical protein